ILHSLDFRLYSLNNTVNFSSNYGLAPGSFYTYNINFLEGNLEKIEITPIVQYNGGQEECSKIYVNSIRPCFGEEVSFAEPEYYLDANLNVILINGALNNTSNISTNITDNNTSRSSEILNIFSSKPQKKILTFIFEEFSESLGTIDEIRHRISVVLPENSSKQFLTPRITISPNASIIPFSGISKNFTNPVVYTVTASDNSTQHTVYTTVFVAPVDKTGEITLDNELASTINLTDSEYNETWLAAQCANGSCSISLEDIYWGNETPVNVPPITTTVSSTVAGEWTNNLSAAKQMALSNKNFYIINYGNLKDCTQCRLAESSVFNKSEFKEWARANGIAMFYANSDYNGIEPIKTVYTRYILPMFNTRPTIDLPQIIIVGYESDGAVAAFNFVPGKNINGISAVMTPKGFIQIVDSYTVKYRVNVINLNLSPQNNTLNISAIISSNISSSNVNWTIASNVSANCTYVGMSRRCDYGIYNRKPTATTGSEAGQWTYDLVAARALAKQNNKFYLIKFSSDNCAYCSAADNLIFLKPEFIKWAVDNGLPLVYADRTSLGTTSSGTLYAHSEPGNTIQRLYPGLQYYPTMILVEGAGDGKREIGRFVVRGGSLLTPMDFVNKTKSIIGP
ncbi:MAG: hypothetical protein WCI72_06910, partial [archaeon]